MLDTYPGLKNKLTYLDKGNLAIISIALNFSANAHKGQFRRCGKPYISHPVAVAEILASLKMDYKCIVAGLLHDVLEDTPFKYDDIVNRFDREVALLVKGVTKIKKMPKKSRRENQAENFRKMLMAISKDIRVLIIKLSDRLHNMRTLGPMSHEHKKRIAGETLEIYAPLAKRLGMKFIAMELENIGFAALYPLRHRVLEKAVSRDHGKNKLQLSHIMQKIEAGLNIHNISYSSVSGREKHIYSIYRKMRDNNLSFSEISDVFAIRVSVKKNQDCYVALGVVHSVYRPLPGSFKDYIALPKANGYQSLHTILFGPGGVKIEVQIRTCSMDKVANSGVAAHGVYKSRDKFLSTSHLNAQQWLNKLMDMQRKSQNSLEFIENVKIDLCPEEVYVFTPEGDIIELPSGACVVDFAYAVHTMVGNNCIAAKIDQKISTLTTVLESGQVVDVISKKGSGPSKSWLDVVVTGKAKTSIRYYFKMQRNADLAKLGWQMLSRVCGAKFNLDSVSKDILGVLAKRLNYRNYNNIFEAIALGNRSSSSVANDLKSILQEYDQSQVKLIKSRSKETLLITGNENMAINYASCCRPVPGDDILSFMIPGKGVYVHQKRCNSLPTLKKDGGQKIKVAWSKSLNQFFYVDLTIDVLNRTGVLAAISMCIAKDMADIRDIGVSMIDDNAGCVKVKLLVRNRMQLSKVIRSLRRERCVLRIKRGL